MVEVARNGLSHAAAFSGQVSRPDAQNQPVRADPTNRCALQPLSSTRYLQQTLRPSARSSCVYLRRPILGPSFGKAREAGALIEATFFDQPRNGQSGFNIKAWCGTILNENLNETKRLYQAGNFHWLLLGT